MRLIFSLQAADLALKFLDEQKADKVLKNAASMLLGINKHSSVSVLPRLHYVAVANLFLT